jgi:galactokinase
LAASYPGLTTLRDASLEQLAAHAADLPDAVARRCRFIVEENGRVAQLARALRTGDCAAIHSLTANSFAGARALYEIVSPEMDAMMTAMLDAPGIIGARQAGAGFGGCMVAFVESAYTGAFARHVEYAYRQASGIQPAVYPVHAAPGAGSMRLRV